MEKLYVLAIGLAVLFQACAPAPAESNESAPTASNDAKAIKVSNMITDVPVKLGDYWYQGKGEINHYKLEQNRYKDVHPGEVVMVFVTEDFLTDKQVKNDNYQNPNSTGVLKLNQIRRFSTGIYDYSIMTSVFTPVDTDKFPHTLKVTQSSQDWCGHTFTQLNYENDDYRYQLRSYFESEGDVDKTVPALLLEDELFNRLRMNPELLPTGKIKVLPSTTFARLKHTEFAPMDAEVSRNKYIGKDFSGENLMAYQVKYPKADRTLEIVYEAKAPYPIIGWTDSYPSAFDKQMRTTKATRTNVLLTPYWENNKLEDTAMRKDLGLEVNY
ncbi:MAG: hypothetical protein DHS20C18_43870 [Saprospiraceae bacterium]|nr:MAG: hypothetical protein DHS20C18_43870 [Saprospiraceae bacterium]